ncbi:TetR/AcrR family transcriptional regulator [Streptomyces rubradiris]|uniref:TetR/AcrR family transcriptional regulator n=1 Tax=Streptomyces rubradiris TaxID=285531 RepID=UPI0033F0A326
MTQQDRARRTRVALIRAAALEFDRDGYVGASMGRIAQTAGLSMGALTFHFSSKSDVADAVVEHARAVIVSVLDDVGSGGGDAPLDHLGRLVVALARTLYDNVEVRGAARLEYDRPEHAVRWSSDWFPVMRHLAVLACRSGEVSAEMSADRVAQLAALLVRAAEVQRRIGADSDGFTPQQFAGLWGVAVSGIRA